MKRDCCNWGTVRIIDLTWDSSKSPWLAWTPWECQWRQKCFQERKQMIRSICQLLHGCVRGWERRDCCMWEIARWQHSKHVQLFNSRVTCLSALFHLYKYHPIN